MKKRLITAVLGISVVLLIIYFSNSFPIILNIAIALIGASCVYELCTSMKLHHNLLFFIPCIVFTTALPIIAYAKIWSLLWFIYTIIVFVGIILKYDKIVFKDIISAYCLTLLISIALGSIIMLRDYGSGYIGVFYFILPLVIAWMTDGGAYFIGKSFGRNKLCPHISPNKTIEGAIGGIAFGILGSILCILVFKYLVFTYADIQINVVAIIIMTVVASVLSIVGDLAFSIVKRNCKVKDFGDVMPGHGGFLDRFDSIMFVAPFIYIVVRYLPLAM